MSSISRARARARRKQQEAGTAAKAEAKAKAKAPAPAQEPERQTDATEAAPQIHPEVAPEATNVLQDLQTGEFGDPDSHLVSLLASESVESEHYRTVRYTIERLHQSQRGAVVGIISPSQGDGKTLTTLNIAGSLGQDPNARVLVVDSDFRSPSVGRFLGMRSNSPGFSEALLRTDCSLVSTIRRHPRHNLAVLPAGTATTAPYEAFKSPRMGPLLREARSLFDYILLDMAPLLFPEGRLLEAHMDGFLVVIAAHRTKRRAIEEAVQKVDSSKLIGFLFNGDTEMRTRIPGYYRYKRE